MEKIDFVVTWVDGDDPVWQEEKDRYNPNKKSVGASKARFRDWDLMRYWFRAVEKFAPWVNQVHFVTWGHLPPWLDENAPKLHIVNHADFIPEEYRPTFSCNPIELLIHRIPGLGDKFVVFNDDMFLVAPTEVSDFFTNGVPREIPMMDSISGDNYRDPFPHMLLNNIAVINKHFSKSRFVRENWKKLYHPKSGTSAVIRNLLMTPFPRFTGFQDAHVCTSYVKQTFLDVWEAEPEILAETCRNRFRTNQDLTVWVMKQWQMCAGNFAYRPRSWGSYIELVDGVDLEKEILGKPHKCICLNDVTVDVDFDKTKAALQAIFEKLLPEKSSFEKM